MDFFFFLIYKFIPPTQKKMCGGVKYFNSIFLFAVFFLWSDFSIAKNIIFDIYNGNNYLQRFHVMV